jgi:hypothetical protein
LSAKEKRPILISCILVCIVVSVVRNHASDPIRYVLVSAPPPHRLVVGAGALPSDERQSKRIQQDEALVSLDSRFCRRKTPSSDTLGVMSFSLHHLSYSRKTPPSVLTRASREQFTTDH